MSDPQPTKRVHPTILRRARELRREMTPQERKLWRHLRGKQLYGIKFRRQHPIDRFILDFFCYEHKLAIEIDGHSHYQPDQQEYDQARTEWLAGHGIRVIRFTNRDVDTNLEGVLDEIGRACEVGADSASPPSNSPQRGEDRSAASKTASSTEGEDRSALCLVENQASPHEEEEDQSAPRRGEHLTSPPLGGTEGGRE